MTGVIGRGGVARMLRRTPGRRSGAPWGGVGRSVILVPGKQPRDQDRRVGGGRRHELRGTNLAVRERLPASSAPGSPRAAVEAPSRRRPGGRPRPRQPRSLPRPARNTTAAGRGCPRPKGERDRVRGTRLRSSLLSATRARITPHGRSTASGTASRSCASASGCTRSFARAASHCSGTTSSGHHQGHLALLRTARELLRLSGHVLRLTGQKGRDDIRVQPQAAHVPFDSDRLRPRPRPTSSRSEHEASPSDLVRAGLRAQPTVGDRRSCIFALMIIYGRMKFNHC